VSAMPLPPGAAGPGALAARLQGRSVVVCAGSGGVGKTTTSAAIAMGLAAQGLRVAVVTIDPARRLANALGLDELGNEPERVDGARFTGHGIELDGELWAMMLDPKRTLDELIESLATSEAQREQILTNRIYQQLSSAVAGSQEFSAVAKLYDLHRSGRFDVLVLDTPPSRNALDFLDAPDRLTGFFEGRALRVLLAPTGLAAKVVGRGTGVVFAVLRRLTGVDLLDDLSVFFRALGGIIERFRERAEGVKALLADPATVFLVIASPEHEPVEEAIFFSERLGEAGMALGGLVVNRVRVLQGPDADADQDALRAALGDTLAAKVTRAWDEERVLARRDAASIAHLLERTGQPEAVVVPQLPGDVHDVDGLVAVHAHLFA
jgi:anion-transporting  ArsA/GET3 family ATPase